MQYQESGETTFAQQEPRSFLQKDSSGLSNGTFASNRQSLGGAQNRRETLTSMQQTPQRNVDLQSSAYDMNYTPLLPSQLLMGSPFQPGSPATFASPQFQSFPAFAPHQSVQSAHQQMGQFQQQMQPQSPMGPQLYQNMMGAAQNMPQYLGGMPATPLGQPIGQQLQNMAYNPFAQSGNMQGGIAPGMMSRTVYLGNIPADTTAEEILNHVRSGQIESVRVLPDKTCAFISFLESDSANRFHADAILKKLTIHGQDIKVGWGKPSPVSSSVQLAVQQSGASRNVYLGNLPADISEDEIRDDLTKFGAIDTIKLVREKNIGFVHFLSISSAVKAVSSLPQEDKWQPPRRVFYGKDRCAYISKTQQQNAAQFLGITPGYAHVLNVVDREIINNMSSQQNAHAAAVATAAGGPSNLGNRTIYLGNIHPETTIEEVCNVVRGGLLHHIRYIPDKHICFVTFIDPTAAASFYATSNGSGLMIHNRRLKIGWGKHSGILPSAISMAVAGGASRNVYIGNIDESWTEERLRQDFNEYGETELINTLREKSCAFVNFTNIANAIKAIEAIKQKEEYKRFKVNFGKDRCGNPPRQMHQNHQDNFPQHSPDGMISPPPQAAYLPQQGSQGRASTSPTNPGYSGGMGQFQNGAMPQQMYSSNNNNASNAALNGVRNPMNTYFNLAQQQQQQQNYGSVSPSYGPTQQQQQTQAGYPAHNITFQRSGSFDAPPQSQSHYASHASSSSFSTNAAPPAMNGHSTVGGLLAPATLNSKHSRAISLPAFSQGPTGLPQPNKNLNYGGFGSGLGLGNGSGFGFGLGVQGDSTLPRWAEEDAHA
jgi:RNA recognition motif-containing protein